MVQFDHLSPVKPIRMKTVKFSTCTAFKPLQKIHYLFYLWKQEVLMLNVLKVKKKIKLGCNIGSPFSIAVFIVDLEY